MNLGLQHFQGKDNVRLRHFLQEAEKLEKAVTVYFENAPHSEKRLIRLTF